MRRETITAAAIAFLAWGCGQDPVPEKTAEPPKAEMLQECPPPGVVPQTNLEMAAILKELYQRGSSDPQLQFSNHAAAAYWQQRAAAAVNLGERMQWSSAAAFELLNAGEIRASIALSEEILKNMDSGSARTSPEGRRKILSQLGLEYLRLGERENCQVNHTSASCLMPIAKEGQHKLPEGSRKAMEIFGQVLTEFPNDLPARWLYNVAAMTLGEYPNKVPKQWLIPPSAFGPSTGFPRFTDIAMDLGLEQDMNRLAGGSCMDDFNGDGLIDLLTSSWSLNQSMRLFINKGDGTFEETTQQAGLAGITGGLFITQADYDNDGKLDVLVLRGGWTGVFMQPNSLLHNLGNGVFQDVTKAAGLFGLNNSQAGVWGDFDHDGWLDIFIGKESVQAPVPAQLFHNNHDGTFTDIAEKAGVNCVGFIKGVAAGDLNNDGWLDIYVSDCSRANRLFINRGPDASGTWKFEDIAVRAGVTKPDNSFPTWIWDYDNDGWMDIFVSNYDKNERGNYVTHVSAGYSGLPFMTGAPNLYHNNKDGTFEDVTKKAGLYVPLFTMGCNIGDLDNDGFLDFYVATGEPDLRAVIPNRMFHNTGKGTFEDVTSAGGFGHLQKGHSVTFADPDNDGDQDIFVNMGGAFEGDGYQKCFFENPGMGNHWVTLIVQGTKSPRCALHARIRVTVATPQGERNIYSVVSSGASFGANSLQQEIGLGKAERIVQVEVTWPKDNKSQVFRDVQMDGTYRLVEDAPNAEVVKTTPIIWKKGGSTGHHVHTSL